MKYVLFVSISYKHYKKENYFRIFLDDILVDEITLSKDINRVGIDFVKNNLDKDSWLRRDLIRKDKTTKGKWPLLTERLWIYEVEIPEGNEPEIKLDFKIADSNYTNGFMTKSAMVRLEKIGLVSLHEFKKMLKGSYYEAWGYFKNQRKKFIEMLKHELHQGFIWPTMDKFAIKTKNESTEVQNLSDWDEWIGEDFTAKVKTITKHRTLILQGDSIVPKGLVSIDPIFLLLSKHKDVINIYNEDIRSNI